MRGRGWGVGLKPKTGYILSRVNTGRGFYLTECVCISTPNPRLEQTLVQELHRPFAQLEPPLGNHVLQLDVLPRSRSSSDLHHSFVPLSTQEAAEAAVTEVASLRWLARGTTRARGWFLHKTDSGGERL